MNSAGCCSSRAVAPWRSIGAKVSASPTSNVADKRRDTWLKVPLTFDNIEAAEQRARVKLADKPDLIARLEDAGRERELIYKTLVLTGLRKGELASLTVAQVDLDADVPYIVLDAADEKNRQGSELPVRDDLAEDIRALAGRQAHGDAGSGPPQMGEPIPIKLAGRHPAIQRAGRAAAHLRPRLGCRRHRPQGARTQRPARAHRQTGRAGRTIDVHALRTTFGTHLSKGGVAPRTAQAAMRHSDIKLTMGVYTDPRLLDVRGASGRPAATCPWAKFSGPGGEGDGNRRGCASSAACTRACTRARQYGYSQRAKRPPRRDSASAEAERVDRL